MGTKDRLKYGNKPGAIRTGVVCIALFLLFIIISALTGYIPVSAHQQLQYGSGVSSSLLGNLPACCAGLVAGVYVIIFHQSDFHLQYITSCPQKTIRYKIKGTM